MRILLANSFYHPTSVGGAEHSVRVLAECLVRSGHEVTVLTLDGASSETETSCIGGVRVVRLAAGWFGPDLYLERGKRLRKLNALVHGINNRLAHDAVSQFCAAWKPDVLHSNSLYGLSQSIWHAAAERGVPLVHTLRDYALIDPRGVLGLTPSPIRQVHEARSRNLAARLLSFVTAPSARTLEFHLERHFFRTVPHQRVPNCIEFDRLEVQRIAATKQRRKTDAVRLLYAGTLAEYKGVDTLLTAFAASPAAHLRLEICGAGRLESDVLAAARHDSRIRYWGQLSRSATQKRMAECDILVAPSAWDEPFGRVVIEAFAHAMPVIGSDRGGIAEILRDCSGGRLFRAGDATDLAQAIESVSRRSCLPPMIMGAVAALDAYSPVQHAAMFSSVYQSAISGQPAESGI